MEKLQNLRGKVQTVTGLTDPEALGPTLMHEHILCDLTPPGRFRSAEPEVEISLENTWEIRYHWCNHPGNNRLDQEEVAVRELVRMREAGGRSVVELTCRGLKRNPVGLRRVSEQANVNIIMGCGYYTEEFLAPGMREMSVQMIAGEMISDILEGVGDTGIRAGIIGEIGCSFPQAELEKRVLCAAVIAQRETGAAINIHPGRHPEAPLGIVRYIERNGGDPSRVIVSHIDRTIFDHKTLFELAETGCMIEYDFFGIESSYYPFQDVDLPNDGMRLKSIRALIDKGRLSQVVISQDICSKTRLVCYGGHGYGHIFANIVPMMRRKGFSDSEIEAVLVQNPGRLVAFV